MRSFLFLFFLIFSLSSFADCPPGTTSLNYTSTSGIQDLVDNFISPTRPADSLITAPGPQSYQTWLCKLSNSVDCSTTPARPIKKVGQYRINYSCQPRPCPDSHPTAAANFTQCHDSNGCNQDQSFLSGFCVNKKIEDITARCMSAAGGGHFSINVPSDGSGPTCAIGTVSGFGSAPDCKTSPGGVACFALPGTGAESNGYSCGTFNGAPLCVSSSTTSAIGTTSKTPGTSTVSGTAKTIEEQVSTMGQTTTTVKTTTPQTTTTVSISDGSLLEEGQTLDVGAGPVPVSPHICSDGRLASDSISCDSAVVCPVGSYISYGACIKMPTRTTVSAKDSTTTTVTVKNDSSGATVSQSSSTSSVSTPVKNPTAPGTVETQRSGQCDPTAKNYQECLGLLSSVSDTKDKEIVDSLKTQTDTALTASVDAVNTSINATSTGLGTNTSTIKNLANSVLYTSSTCTSMTIQIGPLSKSLTCEKFVFFKSLLGWFLFAFTLFYFIHLFFKPVER